MQCINIGAVGTDAAERWLLANLSDQPDPRETAITGLLVSITAGFTDILECARVAASAADRERMLRYLVTGEGSTDFSDELELLRAQVRARWQAVNRAIDLAKLIPLLAGVGSGIFADELARVGRQLAGQTFPHIPRLTFEQIRPLQVALYAGSLAVAPNNEILKRAGLQEHAVLHLNPLLRPLARYDVDPATRRDLDRWTIAYARDKINFFSSEWFAPSKRARTRILIEYAQPLFAIAIWLAYENPKTSEMLRAAILRAQRLGWWPTSLDPTPLLGELKLDLPPVVPSEIRKLMSDAMAAQMQDELSSAIALWHRVLERVDVDSIEYTSAHLRLGTIYLDDGDTALAAEHLLIAMDVETRAFVPGEMQANIALELGQLATLRGRHGDTILWFTNAIERARGANASEVECLCFIGLCDAELRQLPAFVLYPLVGARTIVIERFGKATAPERAWPKHLAQAKAYVQSAWDAFDRIQGDSHHKAALWLLEARILGVESGPGRAIEKAEDAHALYQERGDRRIIAVNDFLKKARSLLASLDPE